jgi:hypothetical protein
VCAGRQAHPAHRHLERAQLFIWRGRHFDVDIDAVKQRAADLAQIPLDDGRRAAALALFRFEPNRTKRVSLAHQRALNADQT